MDWSFPPSAPTWVLSSRPTAKERGTMQTHQVMLPIVPTMLTRRAQTVHDTSLRDVKVRRKTPAAGLPDGARTTDGPRRTAWQACQLPSHVASAGFSPHQFK